MLAVRLRKTETAVHWGSTAQALTASAAKATTVKRFKKKATAVPWAGLALATTA